MKDATLIIKSFLRLRCVERLLRSINEFCPYTPVIIADDSQPAVQGEIAYIAKSYLDDRLTFLKLSFDVGVPVGRNCLVDAVETPYVVLFDDDFVLTEETRLEVLVDHLRADTYDVVGGSLMIPRGGLQHYEGYIERRPDSVYLSPLEQYEYHQRAEVVMNFFAAKTVALRAVRWDENLKQSEHLDFFMQCQQHGVRVGYEPTVKILHWREQSQEYRKYRMRFLEDRNLFFKKWGIKEVQGAAEPR